MNRRKFLGFPAIALSLSACSSGNVAVKTLGDVIDLTTGKRAAFDPDYPDSLPYASIAITRKGMSRALLILSQVENGELHWVSADRGVLVTRRGRLVKTFGLPENIQRTEFSGPDHFQVDRLPVIEKNMASTRIVDLSPGNRYGLVIKSSLVAAGEETITIGKHQHRTWRFNEHCQAEAINWRYMNSYWLDETGLPWRSEQTLGPQSAPILIEITKPYRGQT